ncbi:N2227-domain-containing protein [Laetiporus sulphureus 93-53]|uniref:N2227-domain-containing protein n=1 Tax=Laetiporus sulphureus 93-53 TaxID=1314785 RepID=A0A165DQN7_9APHY|nr:N2227-domain-containing protein [Laetiporus sulphureus 93-53]KZT05414.1 N2227-domain-containing protein [Laetiporus sulphureus 93-53]
MDRITHFLASDSFLAVLIPLLLSILGLQLVGTPSVSDLHSLLNRILRGARGARTPSHFSVERAVRSYEQYAELSGNELARMRASYAKLGRAHKRIGYELAYPRKLDRLQEAICTNALVAEGIVRLAREQFRERLQEVNDISGDLVRVRESLRHFVRDWSNEGKDEREKIFGPILDVLREVDEEARRTMSVLVPGSGLGRLAWEISQLGFHTTANELSFFMNLAFRFLLSDHTTQHVNQHTLQPYASWFSHQRTTDSVFRAIAFPDVVPRLSPSLQLAEQDFLSLRMPPHPSTKQIAGYDFIVTLFFIDTSLNVLETIEHVHELLRPGGTWINLGPLLWTGGGQAAVELSLEEVMALVAMTGFRVEKEGAGRRRSVECEYTADRRAMMRWLYQAEFWAATKI